MQAALASVNITARLFNASGLNVILNMNIHMAATFLDFEKGFHIRAC
jgi:hypothetical protein